MAVAEDAQAHVRDLFAGLGAISTRAMFGGAGVYCDGVMFALIGGDRAVYLKAEGVLARAMQAEGSEPFTYLRDGAPRALGYWRMPETGYEDPEEACLWGARSLDLARAVKRG
jgi:DNA transformation protein